MYVDDRMLIVWGIATRPWNRMKKYFTIKDNKKHVIHTCPRVDTVLTSLICLIVFFITAIFAIIFPTVALKRITVGINASLALMLGLMLALDMWKRGWNPWKVFVLAGLTNSGNGRDFRRSLLNTVLTVFLMIVVLTALYNQKWYQALNDVVIRQETDTVVSC